MEQSFNSRAGTLLFITALHLAALWAMIRLANPDATTPPVPLPMVMAQIMPSPQPVLEVPRPQPQQEQKAKPKPQVRPQPTPKTTDSAKALAAPKPAESSPIPAPAEPTASAAPPAPPAPAAPLVLPRFDAAYLNNPPPVYPSSMRRLGEEGRVVLRVLVNADGTPGEVTVLTPSSSTLFDDAALAAVRKWRFAPARRGDTAVAEWVKVPIDFKLK